MLRKPRTVPTKFSRSEIPEAEDFAFLTKVMGDMEARGHASRLGCLKRTLAVKNPSRVLPQHMGVFATTGIGKSNFMKTFCASSMKMQKFGLLMVDPHGEYVPGQGNSARTWGNSACRYRRHGGSCRLHHWRERPEGVPEQSSGSITMISG